MLCASLHLGMVGVFMYKVITQQHSCYSIIFQKWGNSKVLWSSQIVLLFTPSNLGHTFTRQINRQIHINTFKSLFILSRYLHCTLFINLLKKSCIWLMPFWFSYQNVRNSHVFSNLYTYSKVCLSIYLYIIYIY